MTVNSFEAKMNSAWWALRIGLGGAAFLAGLDKFFNLLANWPAYLSPVMAKMLPVSDVTFMHLIGIIEMVVGLAILTRWTRIGGYVAAVWLVAIALNLVTTGRFLDVAVRDVEMAIAAFTLARLTETRVPAVSAEKSPSGGSKPGLQSIARDTGGEVVDLGDAKTIGGALDNAIEDLRRGYTLGFAPSRSGDPGSFHTLRVRLVTGKRCPGCTIQARSGYYAGK